VERLTAAAQARVRAEFTSTRLVTDIAALYERLLERRRIAISARRWPAVSARDTGPVLPDDRGTAS
jgi:hypothetical protein